VSSMIHMDTEAVRGFVVTSKSEFDLMENLVLEISKKVKGIHWEGKSRDEFLREFMSTTNNLLAIIDQGRINTQRVQREADEWLSVDSTGSQNIASIGTVISGLGNMIGSGLLGFWLSFTRDEYEEVFLTWWKAQLIEDKVAFLEGQQRAVAKELGIGSTPLRILDIPDTKDSDARGYYDGKGVFLDIDNLESDKPWHLINTVAHETRHAYQDHVVQVFQETGEPPEGVNLETAQIWQANFEDYVIPEDDFEGYRAQPIEVDARDYGESYADKVLVKQPWKS
jgi:hypothetical protein